MFPARRFLNTVNEEMSQGGQDHAEQRANRPDQNANVYV
jgi:hypothetical protein